jgi:anaerobic C4-dicarboxylate transporter
MTFKAFDVCNILLHIMLISAFLGSYFFTFGAYLEREVLKDQLNYLVDTTLQPMKILVPGISTDIKNKMKSYNFKIDESSDIKTEQQNKKTVDKAIKLITFFFIIGLIVIVILSRTLDREGMSYNDFFKKLITRNLIILIFIAATEFIFAFFFVKNYMSLDTNKLKKQIFLSLDNIKNKKVKPIKNIPIKDNINALYSPLDYLI